MKHPYRKLWFLVPTAIAIVSLLTVPLVGSARETGKIILKSQEPKSAQHGKFLSHKNEGEKIQLLINLKSKASDNLDVFISDLYNPTSLNYKHFLTPDQFAQKFGATKEDADKVKQFILSSGLKIDEISNDHTFVKVSGTAKQIEGIFDVTINNYQNNKGENYYANENSPQLPNELGNLIAGIHGLDNEPHWRRSAVTPRTLEPYVPGKPQVEQPYIGSGPAGGYTPSELRSAYDVNPLISAGYNGTGQTVALFELDGFVQSNITTYNNNYSLGSPNPSTVLVDGYNGAAGAGQGEVELDIEVINALAPKSDIIVYEGPNTDAGVIDTYRKIATDNRAKSVSISWGLCELQSSTSTMNSMHTIFQQMASQGQSVFAASGDSGAYDCQGSNQLAVDSPANDPYVTGVGGTHLILSGGAYGSESVWSSSQYGGGGGLSTVYSLPTWQTGLGTSNSYSNGKREVPDVSADADSATGYSIYSAGHWTVYGGTSAAAPLWAALAAINNQYATAGGKAILGQANPTLYKMFNTTQQYQAYHDITTGTNRYYPAASGYDLASGIGSPDAYNLIRDINGSGSGGGGTSTQLIANGGFESGSSPWTESSSGGYELVTTDMPHSGSHSAFLGGYNNATDSLYQTISIPLTSTTASLEYYTNVSTTETTHSYDFLKVQLRDTSNSVLATLQTLSDATLSGWTKQTFDISAYKGKTLRIYFLGTNDSSNSTDFFIDDVSVTSK